MAGMYPDNETISLFDEEVSWPGVGAQTGKFTNGDFSDPARKPSFIPAETVNLILDNLENLITALGGKPDNTSEDQLRRVLIRALSEETHSREQGDAEVLAAALAHVNSRISATPPLMDGGVSAGTATQFARGDHRHPTDTTRAPLASPALTGTPTAPTAAARNNSAQIATTAYADRAGHPVNSYYIQFPISGRGDLAGMFPANESPAALYGGTWRLEYDTEDVFFRTPGPGGAVGANRGRAWSAAQQWGASGGVAGIEPDAIRNAQGTIVHGGHGAGFRSDHTVTGVFRRGSTFGVHYLGGGDAGFALEFSLSSAVPTDTVNRPRNRLFRIWKRTA
ncbi:MAG: hypothetical protein FWC64_13065 [Treponema sp.]|nr:hypothetical protein [Treponema sp.]